MPIDASIYRQQAQQPSVMENMGHLLGLKAAIQQQQIQSQQQEAAALHLEQQRRAVADDEASRQLFANTPNPTDDQILSTLGAHGIPLLKARREQQKAELDHQTSVLNHRALQAKLGGQILATATDQESYARALPQLAEVLGPDAMKHFGAQYDPAQVRQFIASGMSTEAQLAEARAKLDDARKAWEFDAKKAAQPFQQAKVEAEATTAQQTAAGAQPIQPAQKAQIEATAATRAAQEARDKEQARHNRVMETRPTVNVQAAPAAGVGSVPPALTGEAYMADLRQRNPRFAGVVQGIIEGRVAPPTGRAATSGLGAQQMEAVMAADPGWSMQRAQIRKAFATGADGKNIGALNTAIVHLGRLGDAGEALQNGTFIPGNEAYNWLKDRFGSDKVTNFALLKDAVAGEMAAALKGNATDIEIEKMGKSIRAANSPAQMRGVVQEGMAVLADKANTYRERYQQQSMGDTWSPILPSAQAMLDRHGVRRTGGGGADLSKVSTEELLKRLK